MMADSAHARSAVLILAGSLLLASCAQQNQAYRDGMQAVTEGRFEQGLEFVALGSANQRASTLPGDASSPRRVEHSFKTRLRFQDRRSH